MHKFVKLPEPESYRIKALLDNNIFTIPSYQREYSWDSYEAVDLLHDIVQVTNHKENIHFFGSIVVLPYKSKSGTLSTIIDGQQRISTSIILMAIFRDLAIRLSQKIPLKQRVRNKVSYNNSNDLDYIIKNLNKLLFKDNHNKNTRRESISLMVPQSSLNKFKQNYSGYFNGLVVRDGTAKRYYDSKYMPIKLLHRVHEKMRKTIYSWLKKRNGMTNKVNFLSNLVHAFLSNFYVVLINAPTREDAITIYMTLNNRGKDLSTSDIVKGQLAGVLEDNDINIYSMMNNWEKMSKKLDNNNKIISDFIREYWAASHNVVPNNQLARVIIHNITTPELANQMINDLLKLVPIYKTLRDPSSNKDIFDLLHLVHVITILNNMGLQQYYSVILAMCYRNYDENDINHAMNIIKDVEMRKLPFHSLHTHYSNLISKRIWDNKLNNLQDIIQALRGLKFSNARTKSICATYQHKGAKNGKGVRIISYMLSGIYSLNGDFNGGTSIYQHVFFNRDYHIIHLATSGIDNAYMDYMGNWTILENDLYAEVNKHRSFDTLTNALSKSKLKSNNLLSSDMKLYKANYDMNKLIIARQNKFANDYIKVW